MDPEREMRAMVLCAGHGTRLGDLTRDVPKPMLRLQGRPLLEYLIAHLGRQGFGQVAVNVHFMPHVITDYFGDGSRWTVSLAYSHEAELLGTAGGVKRMEHFLRTEDPFLVQYGDVLTDQDFTAMLRFHRERRAMATVLVHQRARSNSVVTLDQAGRVVGFLERPSDDARSGVDSTWVNSGVCICEPGVLGVIAADIPSDLPRDVFPELMDSGRLFGFPLSGYRCAVDSPERLAEARSALVEERCGIWLP
jgi:mannose-1-phosphate guanylyltransferase/phosphomannomutase